MKPKPQQVIAPSIHSNVLATLMCLSLISGCASGPNFDISHPLTSAPNFQLRTDYASQPLSVAAVPTQWWALFNDKLLMMLEEKAFASNLDLQIAASRIEQSRAQLGIAAATQLPTLGASASYAQEALSQHGKFAALGAPTTSAGFYQLGFDASWELDLWGKAKHVQEEAAALLEATQYEQDAAGVSLAAEVAKIYLQLRGTQAQLNIAKQNQAIAEHMLRLADSREENGVATRYDTSIVRAQLATIRATVPAITQRRNALTNALALLMGADPQSLDTQLHQGLPLPTLPAIVPVGVSSELAQRRPDILRAQSQLRAATAAIGAAKADFYPRVGLKGRIGVEAFERRDLGDWDARYFSLGPTIYIPIFQGGQLVQRLALSEAKQKTAALAYRQTVLQAWHEVDNALDAWATQQRQHAELKVSCDQNEQALQLAMRAYHEGVTDYYSVLSAQRNLLVSQSNLSDSTTQVALALVNLYKSLGGGWEREDNLSPLEILPTRHGNGSPLSIALSVPQHAHAKEAAQ